MMEAITGRTVQSVEQDCRQKLTAMVITLHSRTIMKTLTDIHTHVRSADIQNIRPKTIPMATGS